MFFSLSEKAFEIIFVVEIYYGNMSPIFYVSFVSIFFSMNLLLLAFVKCLIPLCFTSVTEAIHDSSILTQMPT